MRTSTDALEPSLGSMLADEDLADLTDVTVGKACQLLAAERPSTQGLDSLSAMKAGQVRPAVGECVHIHHVPGGHWVCSYAPGYAGGKVAVFDSLLVFKLGQGVLGSFHCEDTPR